MEEETTFEKLKKGLLELLRGYPNYIFFGKIEYYLQDGKVLSGIDTKFTLKILKKHNIIEFASKEEANKLNKKLTSEQWAQIKAQGKKQPTWYRLAPKGIDLAISLINKEHNERIANYQKEVLRYARETQKFNVRTQILTIIMVILTAGLFTFGIIQLFFKLPIIDIISFLIKTP